MKSKYRANLSDDHLQSLLVIGVTDFIPNYKEILQKKSTVPSLPLKCAENLFLFMYNLAIFV